MLHYNGTISCMHTAERRRPLNHLFRENLKKLLIFILVCMLSLGAFFCLYSHDNKYTARSVRTGAESPDWIRIP